MTIITNARFPGSARRVDIAIKGGAIAAITPAGSRISATATGGAATGPDREGVRSCGELEWFDAYCKLDNAPGAAEETLELIRKAEAMPPAKAWSASATMRWRKTSTRGPAGSPRRLPARATLTIPLGQASIGMAHSPTASEDCAWRRACIPNGWRMRLKPAGRRASSCRQRWTGPCRRDEDDLGRLAEHPFAFCSMPYSDIFPDFYGTLSYAPDQIEAYFHVATCHGFAIACHAIGDEANTIVLNAAASTHAHGSIEHARC